MDNNHNLIPREQSFVTTSKLLSVHSDDRNLAFWPDSNTFAITLPAPILNVQSIRLIQSTFPSSLYVFSENQRNTKFNITIGNNTTATQIEINEGIYTDVEFVIELNRVLSDIMPDMTVTLSSSNRKLTFNSLSTKFILNFDKKMDYDECGDNFALANNIEGLPYHMGFENKRYSSVVDDGSQSIVSSFPINIIGESCFYMEIDKYNLLDELSPFNKTPKDSNCIVVCPDNTTVKVIQKTNNNVFTGKSNSAFAKIPLTINPLVYPFNSQFITLCNAGFYDPVIEKISNLRFKFRYHNGVLVDFKNNRFDFILEFTSLRNEISKSFSVRKGVI